MADNTYSAPKVPHVQKRDETVKSPQTGEDVSVKETRVQLDRVVLDPNHEDAVQVPDEAAVQIDHPADAIDGKTPEEQLSGSTAEATRPAKKSEKAS